MTDRLHITDHALLSWMERRHGLDIATWRNLMRDEAVSALRQFEPTADLTGASFVVSVEGKVVGYVEDDHRSAFPQWKNCPPEKRPIFVPRPSDAPSLSSASRS